jgi:hypothetical protein
MCAFMRVIVRERVKVHSCESVCARRFVCARLCVECHSDRKEACVDSRISGARNSQRLSPRWTWRPAERQMDGRPLSARCSHPPAPQPPTAGIDAGREPQRSAGISVDVRTPSRVAVSELNSAGEAF